MRRGGSPAPRHAVGSPDRVPQGGIDVISLTIRDATQNWSAMWRHILFLGAMMVLTGAVVGGLMVVVTVTGLPHWFVGVVTAVSAASPVGVAIARSRQPNGLPK